MQPGLSTHAFFDHRLHPAHLDALAAAGAHTGGTMTIEVFAARHHFDYTDTPHIRETAAWFRSNDVRAVLHQPLYVSDSGRAVSSGDPAQWSRHVAPNLNLISERKSGRIASMDEVKRAIESAEQIPFTAVVLHLGLKDTPWDEPAIEHSITAIEHLKAFASPLGVRLLLENLQSEATTPEHLLYILRTGHFENVGFCLDVGHLHLSQSTADATPDSGVAAAVELLGARIAQVHLHDNHGAFAHKHFNDSGTFSNGTDMKDEHLWPGEGTIDWTAVSSALAPLPAATPGILEIACERDEPSDSVTRKAEKSFQFMEDPQSAQSRA
jgi:sugar phosphate isomerase/epimerase